MSEFKLCCGFSRKKRAKFFNDKEPQEYYYFLVENPEIIPDEYVFFTDKRMKACWIIMSDSLIKKVRIDFGNLCEKEYKFIVVLGKEKAAKFNTNNRNFMVLKTKEYFENTVQKIGFWDSENYFYEVNKEENSPPKPNLPNSNPTSDRNIGTKIFLICLPFLIFALFLLLIKWKAKKRTK